MPRPGVCSQRPPSLRGVGSSRHLEPEMLPAADRGRQSRAGAGRALPVELRTPAARQDRLLGPVEADRVAERATDRPLEVGAQRAWRGVNEDHSTRLGVAMISPFVRCVFPYDLMRSARGYAVVVPIIAHTGAE